MCTTKRITGESIAIPIQPDGSKMVKNSTVPNTTRSGISNSSPIFDLNTIDIFNCFVPSVHERF